MSTPIMHEAVVITQAAPVRVSPVPIEEPVFVLPEASVVRMMEEHEGSVLIRTEVGRTGWGAAVESRAHSTLHAS